MSAALRRPPIGLVAALVAALTIGVGLGIEHGGGTLGTATPPFVMAFGLRVSPLLAVSVAVAALAVVVLPRLLAVRAPAAFAVGLLALAASLGVALNVARFGTAGLDRVFDLGSGGSFEAKNEYLPGLRALSYGPRFFLDRFAELVPALPVNVAGHPPGPLLLVNALGITTPAALAALCVAATALTAPLTYAIGRALHGEATGRVAGALAALSPVALLFGVSSLDAVYAAVGALAAWLLVGPRRPWAGALALAVASLMSWALLAVGAWAALVVAQRDGARRALVLALACGAALLTLDGALAAAYGYDPIGTLRATHAVYTHGVADIRPYGFWLFGSPVAWGVMLGLPIAGAALRAAARRRPDALALAAVLLVAAVAGFTKAETERIWLIFVPLACVAAAPLIERRALRLVAAALLAQALLVQVLFDTVW